MREIRNRHGECLDATFTPGGDRPEILVVAHGVTSHKERPWQVALCDRFAAHGVDALRITYAGNPGSEGRFEDATPSKEVEDLGSVLDALDGRRVVYAGHSMGGAIGVLRAARDPRVAGLVSLAGMVHVAAFFDAIFGHLAIGEPMLGKEHCPMNQALRDDAAAIGSVTAAAAEVAVPWLLVHGTADELVPFQDALDAQAAAGGRPELVALDGVDHRFTDHVDTMCDAVVAWFDRYFEPEP